MKKLNFMLFITIFLFYLTHNSYGQATWYPHSYTGVWGTTHRLGRIIIGDNQGSFYNIMLKVRSKDSYGITTSPSWAQSYNIVSQVKDDREFAFAVAQDNSNGSGTHQTFRIRGDGTTFIGDYFPQHLWEQDNYKLWVDGGIISEALTIKLSSTWPDYVFDEKYKLQSLKEVNDFIRNNNHLPNFPTEEMIKKEGINIEEITIKQQEKIEEIFIYLIELNEKTEFLEGENKSLKNKINTYSIIKNEK